MIHSKDIELAQRLADAAGEAIRPFYRADFTTDRKADASPVTEADRAAEAAMRAILDAEAPRDGALAQTQVYSTQDAGAEREVQRIISANLGHVVRAGQGAAVTAH